MSIETTRLIDIKVVSDCDTSIYSVGELCGNTDLSVECKEFIRTYGYEGVQRLMAELGQIAYRVHQYHYTAPSRDVVYGSEKCQTQK